MSLKLNLDPTKNYILAVSGGVDSMVLFDLFVKQKYNFVVVHFNHQKRASAIKDHELIQSHCTQHKVPYHYIKLNIKGGNFQEAARNLRYLHLQKIADRYQTPYIVTAHHLDDLAETVLMKLIRGSNLLGYSGMQKETTINGYTYLKPFLDVSKKDLISYTKLNNIRYLEDQSNFEDDYLRNRIRHNVLPILKEENNVLKHFKSFAYQSYLASDFIRLQTKAFLGMDLNFNLEHFNQLHLAVKMDIIAYILEILNIEKTLVKIETILNQLASNKPNISITLNKKYQMIKAYNDITLVNIQSKDTVSRSYTLMISHNEIEQSNNSTQLCYNKLDFPIKIRKRLPGDKLNFSYGSKKLKDFLIDKKIPMKDRNELKVIVDSANTILWIPNLYLNETLGDLNKIYLAIKE